jgi:hypothetical protein
MAEIILSCALREMRVFWAVKETRMVPSIGTCRRKDGRRALLGVRVGVGNTGPGRGRGADVARKPSQGVELGNRETEEVFCFVFHFYL